MGNAFTKKSESGGGHPSPQSFDGGGFVPLGLYPNQPQDYDHKVVQRLIVERKLSPIYKGLADVDDLPSGVGDNGVGSPSSAASIASAGPAGMANESELGKRLSPTGTGAAGGSPSTVTGSAGVALRAATSTATSTSTTSQPKRASFHARLSTPGLSSGPSSSPVVGSSRGSLRRSNSCSNTSTTHAVASSVQINPRELYKNPVECPICFLYYPPNINYSRCCDQPVCTECFLQLKRSEVSNTSVECPFCCEPNFGIIYEPPEFSKSQNQSPQPSNGANADPLARSASSLPATGKSFSPPRLRRKKGLSSNNPLVVTCDDIRPDFMRRFIDARYRATAADRRPASDSVGGGWRTLIRQSPVPNVRRSTGLDYAGYLRGMGAELEELMVLEAVRLSLLDEEQRQAQARQQAEAEATAIARSSQELGPPTLSGAVDTASDNSTTEVAPVTTQDADDQGHRPMPVYATDGDRQLGEATGIQLAAHTESPLDAPAFPILRVRVIPPAPGSGSSSLQETADDLEARAGGISKHTQQESPVESADLGSVQVPENGAVTTEEDSQS